MLLLRGLLPQLLLSQLLLPPPTITGTEAGSPRTFLPNGSPSRSTMTATCRPQMWVQQASEGWTNGPPPDGTGSAESGLSEPSLLEERDSREFRL